MNAAYPEYQLGYNVSTGRHHTNILNNTVFTTAEHLENFLINVFVRTNMLVISCTLNICIIKIITRALCLKILEKKSKGTY